MVATGLEDRGNARLARTFIEACTRLSEHSDDILPQEAGPDGDCSVFHVFSLVFPDVVGAGGSGRKNKRMRLHFNKIGYTLFKKEQSRRVPAASAGAKPGNPGYGFRRACWRDTINNAEDSKHCETVLRAIGCDETRIQRAKVVVQEFRNVWDRLRRSERRPGPGRPRKVHVSTQPEAQVTQCALGNSGLRVNDIIEAPVSRPDMSPSLCALAGANLLRSQRCTFTANEYAAAMGLRDLGMAAQPRLPMEVPVSNQLLNLATGSLLNGATLGQLAAHGQNTALLRLQQQQQQQQLLAVAAR